MQEREIGEGERKEFSGMERRPECSGAKSGLVGNEVSRLLFIYCSSV